MTLWTWGWLVYVIGVALWWMAGRQPWRRRARVSADRCVICRYPLERQPRWDIAARLLPPPPFCRDTEACWGRKAAQLGLQEWP